MPALPPYIPSRDSAFSNWLDNFASLIAASPAVYGLTAGDAATISGLKSSWSAAYTPVTSPSTKTPAAVAAKNTARVSVTQQVRTYAQQVSNNPGVSSANKIALGLNPKTSTPAPVSAPTSNPVLTVQSAGNGTLILRYRDSAASVSVKAKPYGVVACQIFGETAATAPASSATALLLATATKSPLTLNTGGFAVGSQLYLWARWVTRTGQYSPWSPMISFTVAGAL